MNAPSDDDLITIPDTRWGDYTPTHDPRLLANFKPRADDILITTAPKSGTTWMQQILHQLRMGGDTGFDSIDDEVPWLELPRQGITWRAQLDTYERIPNPRIFKTHCTFEQTPGNDVVRIIMSSRDPRDCCISYYHHVMDMTDEAREHIGIDHLHNFDDIFETWLEYGAWYRNVRSWWPHFDDRNVLWLRYEDMKTSLEEAIDRITAFLQWDVSHEQRNIIVGYCSFEWMKKHSEKFTRQMKSGKSSFKPGGFIRKGEVGEFKTVLSAEQEHRILAKAAQLLETDCLEFLQLPRVTAPR